MLIRLIKSLFNLFIDEEKEYIDRKIKQYYDLFYKNGKHPLNREQCEAVVRNRRYNQVIAAAGTGKTTVLAYRIKFLIEEGIKPERIIAITYSRKAAYEMEKRLKEEFGIDMVEIRTIHSFAYKIIRRERGNRLLIVTPEESKNIIREYFKKLLKSSSFFYDSYHKFLENYQRIYPGSKEGADYIDYFYSFIDLARLNGLAPDGVRGLLNRDNKEQYYFGLCAVKLYEEYLLYLRRNDRIDFHDMLIMAIEILRKMPEKYFAEYDHMLIDEFQDVSYRQIEFIKLFFSEGSRMKLFCVGDDWQSIYSFQGSEPEYFVNFEKYFGKAARTYLTTNYRSPSSIIDAGNLLISRNRDQLKKTVRAGKIIDRNPVLHILDSISHYEEHIIDYTMSLIKNMMREGAEANDIMVLCRYDEAAPFLDMVKSRLRQEEIAYVGKGNDYFNPLDSSRKPDNAVSVFSIHQAKGCEADNVILLHVVANGPYSFPEAERDNRFLEPVKPKRADNLQEERRLFYVAITRAAENLHILTQAENISPFITEIEPYLQKKEIKRAGGANDFINFTGFVYIIWEEHSEKIKQTGLLVDGEGKKIKFLSWRNSKAPVLKINTWYELRNVKISRYQKKWELLLTDQTEALICQGE